ATETIALLEQEAVRARERIGTALADAQNAARASERVRGVAAHPRAAPAVSEAASAGEEDVATELARKRRAIHATEDAWQRHRADLKAKLDELRITYAPAHPSVIALEEQIRQGVGEPPELQELKRAEGALLDRVKGLSRTNVDSPRDAELGSADLAPAKAR